MRIFIFKVGSSERPATSEEIVDVQKSINDLESQYEIIIPAIVTHHDVHVEVFDLETPAVYMDTDDVDDDNDDDDVQESDWT